MASAALSEPMFLSMREVAEQLSAREFAKLCAIVDALYGKTVTEVSSAHRDLKFVKRKTAVRFDVLDIVRVPKELNVTVCTERSAGAVRITVK